MPYIPPDPIRKRLDPIIDELTDVIVDSVRGDSDLLLGVLNYTITRVLLRPFALMVGKIRYAISPKARGVLLDVQSEMYDRIMRDYEDVKIKENGDVEEFTFLRQASGLEPETGVENG